MFVSAWPLMKQNFPPPSRSKIADKQRITSSRKNYICLNGMGNEVRERLLLIGSILRPLLFFICFRVLKVNNAIFPVLYLYCGRR